MPLSADERRLLMSLKAAASPRWPDWSALHLDMALLPRAANGGGAAAAATGPAAAAASGLPTAPNLTLARDHLKPPTIPPTPTKAAATPTSVASPPPPPAAATPPRAAAAPLPPPSPPPPPPPLSLQPAATPASEALAQMVAKVGRLVRGVKGGEAQIEATLRANNFNMSRAIDALKASVRTAAAVAAEAAAEAAQQQQRQQQQQQQHSKQVETAGAPVQTTRLGGDGDSLGEGAERAASHIKPEHVQGDAPHQTEVLEQTARQASASSEPPHAQQPELPLVDAPASFPPQATAAPEREQPWQMLCWRAQQCAEQQRWLHDNDLQQEWQKWQQRQQQSLPWRTRPGPPPDAELPYNFRYGAKGWLALETYDIWLRGGRPASCVCGAADYGFADGVECDVEGGDITRMCDACTLNHILGCALYTPQWPGDSYAPSFHDALGRFVPGIDTRFPIESQFRAFARFGPPTPPRAQSLSAFADANNNYLSILI